MPLSRLPSLSSLRAFEAAARRGSIKEAACELSVTPGAVSQQIKALEADLGVMLFERKTRAITLTNAGRQLQPDVTESFMKLRDAVDTVRPRDATRLKICAAGLIIRNWLMPRMHRFTEAFPEIETQFQALQSWETFEFGENEIGFRLGKDRPPGAYAREIHRVLLLPLATPGFIKKHNITCVEDARRVPLLQDVIVQMFSDTPGWDMWFEAAGLPGPVPSYAMHFDPSSAEYALDMALAGNGVTLGWSIHCYQALAEGRLVCPFGPVVETDFRFFLMCRTAQATQNHVRAFLDWAEKEAALLSTMRSMHPGAA